MIVVNMQGVTLNLGGKPLLQQADFSVETGERVCLTGRNGAGKSSLLALLGGQLEPDGGSVIRAPGPLGQMPQDVPAHWSGPVFAVVASVLGDEGKALAAAYEASSHASQEPGMQETPDAPPLADASPVDASSAGAGPLPEHASSAGAGSLPEHASSAQALSLPEHGGAWERYGDVLAIIKHLDLDPDADFRLLSGGAKRRVALARALVCSEDLILDEPTNHLDLATIAWLEEYLLRKARTLIFVSHDRAFAQRLATRVVEIDRGGVYSYACRYDQYLDRREERLAIEEREAALFDKKLAQEEVWIRQGIKARRTRNMGRVRALLALRSERANRVAKQGNVRMAAQEAERSGKLVIKAEDLSFAYPGKAPLFSGFSTVIQRGDRVGFIGNNGLGKTTLLRVLLGELSPSGGVVRQGTNLQISYFDQLRETLNLEESVMWNVAEGNDQVIIGGNPRHVAGYLQDFLFTPDRLRLPVKALSGGERNRLLLAKLFTRPSNLLVLDEPTNDLDVETLELLEELLAEYSGTVLIVSHDRRFLDNLVTSVLALEGDGKVHEYVGAYTDWLRQRPAPPQEKNRQPQAEAQARNGKPASPGQGTGKSDFPGQGSDTSAFSRRESGNPAPSHQGGEPVKNKPRKRTFKEQREFDLLTQELAALPHKLETLEQEQRDLEARLAEPAFFAEDKEGFAAAAQKLRELDTAQTALLHRWEFAEQRLAELEE